MHQPAFDLIERLSASSRNTDYDWEALLEANYLALLADEPVGVIDVGGHAGRHARVFQEKLNLTKLWVFEPIPANYAALRELFRYDERVQVSALALSNAKGQSSFFVKTRAPEESGLRPRSFYNDGRNDDLMEILVQVERLDQIPIDFRVDFMKIDTEGGEVDILKGATGLLEQDWPLVSVEYGPGGYDAYGYGAETLFELASNLSYSIFDLFGNRIGSVEEWRSCVGRFYWDFMLIPNRKHACLADRLERIRSLEPRQFMRRSV